MPFCFVCSEKIWVHRFLAKPKRIAAGGMERDRGINPQVVQGDALVGAKPPIFLFFCIKHAKTVIDRVNIGSEIPAVILL